MGSRRAVLATYRLLLRSAKSVSGELAVQQPVDPGGWGQGQHSIQQLIGTAYHKDALQRLLPDLVKVPDSGTFTAKTLQKCITTNFRAGTGRPSEESGSLLDQAFTGLQVLAEQLQLANCSSSTRTEGVKVDFASTYTGRQSLNLLSNSERDQHHTFTYRGRIENHGPQKVQLLARGWRIRNSDMRVTGMIDPNSKNGRGLVGQQPTLKQGDCFEYYSGVQLNTPTGSMSGMIRLAVLDDRDIPQRIIDAVVSPFQLIGSKHE